MADVVRLKRDQIQSPPYASLWRRLKKADALSKNDQKAVLQYIEALLAKKTGAEPGEGRRSGVFWWISAQTCLCIVPVF